MITNVNHEDKDLFRGIYRVYKEKKNAYIYEYICNVSKYEKEIMEKDEGLYSNDLQYYPGEPIYMFNGVDFKHIYKSNVFTDDIRAHIWKYLHELYILGNTVLSQCDEYKNLLNKKDQIKKMINNLHYYKKIKSSAKKQLELEKLQQEADRIDFDKFYELIGEDHYIVRIVIDALKESNMVELLKDPVKLMALVADKDKAHVKEMITSITDMVTKKILSLNITEEQLIDDAKGLVERVLLRIKSMPMMKHVDIDGIVEKIKGFISKTMQSKPSNTESNAESNVESRSNVDIDIDIANLKNDLKQHMSEFIKESSKMGPDVHNTFDVNNITKLLNEL
jgi:hypothetical protein